MCMGIGAKRAQESVPENARRAHFQVLARYGLDGTARTDSATHLVPCSATRVLARLHRTSAGRIGSWCGGRYRVRGSVPGSELYRVCKRDDPRPEAAAFSINPAPDTLPIPGGGAAPDLPGNHNSAVVGGGDGSGGRLIAMAAYGTGPAPQAQRLRELRDATVPSAVAGASLRGAFNAAYCAVSPAMADMDGQNGTFRAMTRVAVTRGIRCLAP